MVKFERQNPIDDAEPVEVSDAIMQQFLGYHLRRVSNLVQADLARTLKEYDLRLVTMSVLAVIVEHPGLRQSQLADALSIERPNLVSVLDELEQRGLVTRARVASDRRAYALSATPEGRALASEALAATAAHEERLFGRLGTRRDAFSDALTTIRQYRG